MWDCVSGQPGKIINVYQPAGKMEEFFRELGKPPKDLITAEQEDLHRGTGKVIVSIV
jgi:hypothetical protein